MINDFPKLSNNTSEALFADDCTIWRSGKNLQQIQHHLQQDLNSIENWCKMWGFTINTEKTVGIMFTRQKLLNTQPNLRIQGRLIKFSNNCKLLGVMFDSHLTWKTHIDYICDRTKAGLNIMRCTQNLAPSWPLRRCTTSYFHRQSAF